MTAILIVEDDPATARALERLFRSAYRVEVVGSLVEARAKLTWKPYRGIVVTDWCFPVDPAGPVIDGAGARVVAYAAQAGIPCVVFSGSEKPAEVGVPWVVQGDVDGLRKAVGEELER